MELQTFECRNCGDNLHVEDTSDAVRCSSCRSVFRVTRAADGSIELTVLKRAIDEVHGRVTEIQDHMTAVRDTTDGLMQRHQAMAAREQARLALDEAREQYATFQGRMRVALPRLRRARRKGVRWVIVGVVALPLGVVALGAGQADPELEPLLLVGGVCILGGLLNLIIGGIKAARAGGKVKRWEAADRQWRQRVQALRAHARAGLGG